MTTKGEGMDNGDDGAASTFERGAVMMRRVYGDALPALPEGTTDFSDVMIRSLFGEVWDLSLIHI